MLALAEGHPGFASSRRRRDRAFGQRSLHRRDKAGIAAAQLRAPILCRTGFNSQRHQPELSVTHGHLGARCPLNLAQIAKLIHAPIERGQLRSAFSQQGAVRLASERGLRGRRDERLEQCACLGHGAG